MDKQVALVTGAGTGIGRAIALRLAGAGFAVALVGRRAEQLAETQAAVEAAGGTAAAFPADLAERGAARDLVGRVAQEWGPVEALVNNAGSSSRVRDARWLSDDEWDAVVEVNLSGVFRLVREVLPGMVERGHGTIVTISSIAGLAPNLMSGAAYSAAKAGVRTFMQFLHESYRSDGVRAVTIVPGEVETPILDARTRPPSADECALMIQPDDVARAVELAVTMPGRTVVQEMVVLPTRPRDISKDCAFNKTFGAPEA